MTGAAGARAHKGSRSSTAGGATSTRTCAPCSAPLAGGLGPRTRNATSAAAGSGAEPRPAAAVPATNVYRRRPAGPATVVRRVIAQGRLGGITHPLIAWRTVPLQQVVSFPRALDNVTNRAQVALPPRRAPVPPQHPGQAVDAASAAGGPALQRHCPGGLGRRGRQPAGCGGSPPTAGVPDRGLGDRQLLSPVFGTPPQRRLDHVTCAPDGGGGGCTGSPATSSGSRSTIWSTDYDLDGPFGISRRPAACSHRDGVVQRVGVELGEALRPTCDRRPTLPVTVYRTLFLDRQLPGWLRSTSVTGRHRRESRRRAGSREFVRQRWRSLRKLRTLPSAGTRPRTPCQRAHQAYPAGESWSGPLYLKTRSIGAIDETRMPGARAVGRERHAEVTWATASVADDGCAFGRRSTRCGAARAALGLRTTGSEPRVTAVSSPGALVLPRVGLPCPRSCAKSRRARYLTKRWRMDQCNCMICGRRGRREPPMAVPSTTSSSGAAGRAARRAGFASGVAVGSSCRVAGRSSADPERKPGTTARRRGAVRVRAAECPPPRRSPSPSRGRRGPLQRAGPDRGVQPRNQIASVYSDARANDNPSPRGG